MPSERVNNLIHKLERGLSKSQEIFTSLTPEQWHRRISSEPGSWTVKELAAHFVYSEEYLLRITKDIVSGGEGISGDFNIDSFNSEEMTRFENSTPGDLLSLLADVRGSTLEWVRTLDDRIMDQTGRHPVLGEVNVETAIHSIYAHQLLHMREVIPRLKDNQK